MATDFSLLLIWFLSEAEAACSICTGRPRLDLDPA
jgi:hypothetical protein